MTTNCSVHPSLSRSDLTFDLENNVELGTGLELLPDNTFLFMVLKTFPITYSLNITFGCREDVENE